MKKLNSTYVLNEEGLVLGCPMTYTFTLLGKRWKPIILWKIHKGCRTSAELRRSIPLISRKMLFEELRELISRGLVVKRAAGPRVHGATHELTPLAETLLPILDALQKWGVAHRSPTPESRNQRSSIARAKPAPLP